MSLIGITDERRPTETDSSDWPCPISADELDVLTAASNHQFFKQLVREGKADGYIHADKIVGALCSGKTKQCDCVAHQKLCDLSTSEADLEDLKQLIRTPPTESSHREHLRRCVATTTF